MNDLLAWVVAGNAFLWQNLLIFLLCGTGVFFTLRLGGVQVRKFGRSVVSLFGNFSLAGESAGKHGMSSFQALSTAIAAQVGTGNLVGAVGALLAGGPGAIFWMWVAAFFGMATIFAEACLAQIYRTKDESGQIVGGPAYYISKGLGNNALAKALAAFFAIAIILALGFMGNMVQANSISDACYQAFGVPQWGVGLVLAAVTGLIFIGGIRRIAGFAEKVVPFMAIVYIVVGVAILVRNSAAIPGVFSDIIYGAFNPKAVWGGALGVGMAQAARYGIARGLFSNEAGMGSTPHAHAAAVVKHPVDQGIFGIISVFIDTFIVLNITVFTVMTSGIIKFEGGKPTIEGILLVQKAFSESFLGTHGAAFIAVCLFFFAFTTIIGWYYFAETNIRYLFGVNGILPFQVLVMIFVFVGSILKIGLVWELADFFNGIMVIPNLIALLILSGKVSKLLGEYNQGIPYDPSKYNS